MAKKRSDTSKKRDDTLFSPGKARWLLENVVQLDEDQRALLLAIAELSKDTGRKLTDEEHAALDRLAAEMQGFNPAEIQAAVQKMIESKTQHKSDQDWSDISRRLKRAKK